MDGTPATRRRRPGVDGAVRSFEFQFRPSSETTAVRAGRGVLDAMPGEVAAAAGRGRVVVVSDDRVAPLYGQPAREAIASLGPATELLSFPHGESNKTRRVKRDLEDRLVELGAGRDTVVVAVGGGVTTDLGGFLAATWHRGVPSFLVPTTLLAMVDAAIGGKTGVDVAAAKNAVGAFWQPRAVYADPAVLDTLPDEEFRNGLAEVVKTAVIADTELFATLDGNTSSILARDISAVGDVIAACIAVKGAIVESDPRDRGARASLNFGHTVGHAIETASAYAVPHGPAVAVGMVVEAGLALDHHGFPGEDRDRLTSLLDRLGLPTRLPAGISPDAIEAAATRDKKNRGGAVRFALPVRIGRMPRGPDVSVTVPPGALGAWLDRTRG